MNEADELIFARKALAYIVDEVEALRQQLAAARDEAEKLKKLAKIDKQSLRHAMDKHENLCQRIAAAESWRASAEARAAAEGDRAEGLEVELQHCKAKRTQAGTEVERWRKLAQLHSGAHDRCCEERRGLMVRAEAAEAALEEAQAETARFAFNAGELTGELMVELKPLRRVAEAAQEALLALNCQPLQKWSKCPGIATHEHYLNHVMAVRDILADALGAWDAARGEGGDEDEQEML